MSSRSRVPQLLEPYIILPPEKSLLLLTGVLNATPHWTVTRFLSRLLGDGRTTASRSENDLSSDESKTGVILVSWLRDLDFWKAEARRGGGIDLSRLAQGNRFAFFDGLSDLFSSSYSDTGTSSTASPRSTQTPRGTNLPQRGPASRPQPLDPASSTTHPQPNIHTLPNPSVITAQETISKAITALSTHNDTIFLILDSPTFLLASTPNTAIDLNKFLLSLRSQVHSTLLIVEADAPLIAAASPGSFTFDHGGEMDDKSVFTPVESEHAAFVVSQAHISRLVMSCRPLDTGVAKDVSGVVTVRRGGAWDEDGPEVEEMEALYFVQSDGGVKVFARGSGDVG